MKKKQKKSLIKLAIEFVKLQLAGNILFWGTYIGYFLLHELRNWPDVWALATASIFAHFLFFIANKEWVFDDKTGKRKTSSEIKRFITFMGLNYFINLGIIMGLETYFGITPYIGQFLSGLFFTFWSFIGLRFWVFREVHRHPGLTLESKKLKERRRARTQRLTAKQRAARARRLTAKQKAARAT